MTNIRVGGTGDAAVVGRSVYLALAWNPEREIPAQDVVLAHPEIAIYHANWGRPGDVVVVADHEGTAVGCAFARLFTEDEHGHGFVDTSTPEMGIAIEAGHRGRGLGIRLLEHLHAELERQGIARVSLSVELDNPARRLYERLGYVEVERDSAAIMVKEL